METHILGEIPHRCSLAHARVLEVDRKPCIQNPDREAVVTDDCSCIVGVDIPCEGHIGEAVARAEEFKPDTLHGEMIPEDLKRFQADLLVTRNVEGAPNHLR